MGITQRADHKFILVISSYSPIKEMGSPMIDSFTGILGQKSDIHVAVEYMDSESSPMFESWTEWMRQMFNAYKNKPELVVLLGNEAWSAYRVCCAESWKNTPVVLGAVKRIFLDYEHGMHNIHDINIVSKMEDSFGDFRITGYYYQDYITENVRLIKRLQPHVDKVALFFDNRYSFGFFKDYLLSVFDRTEDLDLYYLNGDTLSTSDLLESTARMDDRYALLSAGWYTDVNHYSHAYSMLHNELPRYTDKFMYQLMDEDFSNMNCIGGYFISGSEVGKDLANLTFRIMSKGIGHVPSFSETPSRPRYHINYPVLREKGIDPDLLPADVVYYNKKPSLLKERPLEIILFLLLLISICLLFSLTLRHRKRKEMIYKTQNDWLIRLLGSMPDMAVICDLEQNIIDIINPQEILLIGHKPEELIGKNIQELGSNDPALHEIGIQVSDKVRQTASTREVCIFSYAIKYKDSVYYAKGNTVPFGDNYVICFAHDITENVVAHNEVQRLKAFLQSVVDNLPIGLFVKDITNDYRYLIYNDSIALLHKERLPYEPGKNDFELDDPLAAKYREEDIKVEHSPVPLSFERVLLDDNGQPSRWGICTKNLCVNNDGSRYIIATVIDTTEIRKKEFEIDEIRKELLVALQAGSMSAWEYDLRKDQLTFLSSSLLPGVESLETLSDYLKLIHPDDLHRLTDKLTEMVGRRTDWVNNLELRVLLPGEEQVYWHQLDGMASSFDKNGNVTRIIGVRRDITRLKMTDELIELRNKAEEANRLKSAFLANMSHEIRTPLNAIVGFSSLITITEDKEEIKEYSRLVDLNNKLLLQLINNVIDLSKIEAGEINDKISLFSLREIFNDLEQIYKNHSKEGVRLECDLPDDDYKVYTEKDRLTQILSNFLNNACKFTLEGSIRMGYTKTEKGLRFFVRDTGIGIAPENIPNVFNNFAKFDSFMQGAGLGLSICESIVQHLKGEIGVNSELGKGSEFWFILPPLPTIPPAKAD